MKNNNLVWIGAIVGLIGWTLNSQRQENNQWREVAQIVLRERGVCDKKPKTPGELKIFLCTKCEEALNNPKATNASPHTAHRSL